MNRLIIDGMKKEGKPYIFVTIASIVLFMLNLVFMYIDKKTYKI